MDLSTMLETMSSGMLRTCGIFFLTLIGSLPLGLVVYFLRQSKIKIVSIITKGFISIMRGTPLMLQLLCFYFGPYFIFKLQIADWRFPSIILSFVLNYAAYFCEIYRGGIESMPIGQYEAAKVLGYSKKLTFRKIILPQVVKRVLPSITNEVITLVKDTSLAFTLAYAELFSIAKQISNAESSFVPLFIAGVFYYIANYAVDFGMRKIEDKFRYYN